MRENNYNHVDKKARFEVEQEEMVQQYQDPRGEEEDPQYQAFLHQQRLIRQQQHQQTLQSMSPYQVRLLQLQRQQQQQQQQLLRRQLQQQQGSQQIHSLEDGVCAQKLMMFLYHIKQRPADNCITFWRGFVAGYFSPRAKQRLCLSHYKKGMFPPAASDVWQCNLCGTKSGKGVGKRFVPVCALLLSQNSSLKKLSSSCFESVEATYDVLARLFEVKFSSGIVDELLSLDYPREYRVSNGKMILSWEFCARGHEEFLVRRVIAPQVNQLLDVTQKFQSTISESGSSEGVSQKDLQTNSNIVLGEGRKLAKVMELESLNDHGYPKKYVRALQVLVS
ncbi:putative transcriptional regulator SLK3 [Raphanus sativus]|nr:putative transcriptional regulator SLK3 [Raphanus sativus]